MIERLKYPTPQQVPTPTQRRDAYRERLRNAGGAKDEELLLRQTAGRMVLAKVRRRERALLRLRELRQRMGIA